MNSNNQNISVIDFNKICRICMSGGNLVNIFDKCHTKDCIFEMLASCTLTMVSEKDELPDKICLQCLDELKVAYKFYQKSEVSDNVMHKLLAKSKQTDQPKRSLSSTNGKTQSNGLKTVIQNNLLDILTLKNDTSVNLNSDVAFKNVIHNDHTYIIPENVCENENSTPKETVFNCNQNDTGTEICDNSTSVSEMKSNRTFECKRCAVTYFTYRELRMHWMTVHGAKYRERECEVCCKFIGYKEFKQHLRSHPQYKPFMCDVCGAKFRLKTYLLRHKVTHLEIKPHSCDKCAKRFTRIETLQNHIKTHHSGVGHLCHVCERSFHSKARLNQHFLTHADKKRLCWFCGKSCPNTGALLAHVKTHTGIKPFRCSYCQKTFRQSGILNAHLRTHTGEKPFVCEYCSKSFTHMVYLKRHIRMHTGVKPYKCSLCGKCYVTSSTLKLHMRRHTGDKRYFCEVCSKGFYNSNHLQRHMKIHSKKQDTRDDVQAN